MQIEEGVCLSNSHQLLLCSIKSIHLPNLVDTSWIYNNYSLKWRWLVVAIKEGRKAAR